MCAFARHLILLVAVIVSESSCSISEFGHCLRSASKQNNLKECVGRTAISFLQKFQEEDKFTISAGIVAAKEDTASSRAINFLDQDPVDFQGILENAGAEVSQRSLQWHLNSIHPGLMLRIGPSSDSNSLMEFVLDPNHGVDERYYIEEETSTARILSHKYLLPLLLGIKFNLAMFVPLVFAGVVLLLKKATFLAKFALFLSSIFGAGAPIGFSGLGLGLGLGGGLNFGLPPVASPHFNSPPIISGGHPFKGVSNYGDPLDNHGYGILRTERKFQFEKPREHKAQPLQAPDRFYNYEKNVLLKDRSAIVFNDELIARKTDGEKQFDNFGSWKGI